MMISISKKLFEAILEDARRLHPKETILLLCGGKRGDDFEITDFIIPPLATYGRGFTSFPAHMLPIDFSIIGTAHSHPSGSLNPSLTDLNNFWGRVLMIVAPPYKGGWSVAVYDKDGRVVELKITDE